MRVIRLETAGVRGLRDAVYELLPDRRAEGSLTVVTGPPQAGLTTFLDAIAICASRLLSDVAATDPADVVRAGGAAATIRTRWWLDADERAFGGIVEETADAEATFPRSGLGRVIADPALRGVLGRYDHSPRLAKVVSIPARRVTDVGTPLLADFEVEQRHRRLSPDPGKLSGLAHALLKHASGAGDRAKFEEVQKLFGELCATVRIDGVGPTGQLEFLLSSGARIPLHRLGFSERNAFVLAAAPVLMGLARSVVLLDTPELGLAPGVAARWLAVLRGATPAAQWIVASRDPAVVASVEPHDRIELSRAPDRWRST